MDGANRCLLCLWPATRLPVRNGEESGYSLGPRLICDGCTPSRLQLIASLALGILFAAAVLTMLLDGYLTFG